MSECNASIVLYMGKFMLFCVNDSNTSSSMTSSSSSSSSSSIKKIGSGHYADIHYWDERYREEEDEFDWLREGDNSPTNTCMLTLGVDTIGS